MHKPRLELMCISLLFLASLSHANEGAKNQMDDFSTGSEQLRIVFYGHASLLIEYNGLRIYVDPVSMFMKNDDYPKADLILLTHEHPDHLDAALIQRISKDSTEIVASKNCAEILHKGLVMLNAQKIVSKDIGIEAVPAYNTTPGREQNHPKGSGNGYILSLGEKRIYIAGDTELIPEMSRLGTIDIAFLPVNQPYTMTVEQFATAIRMISPKIAYPYHLGDTSISALENAVKDIKGTEVRIYDLH